MDEIRKNYSRYDPSAGYINGVQWPTIDMIIFNDKPDPEIQNMFIRLIKRNHNKKYI